MDEAPGGRFPFFIETQRSRGVMAWTNDQTGHRRSLGGVARGGGPPSPHPMFLTRPRGEGRRETIKQIERRAGSSHHESRAGKIIGRV